MDRAYQYINALSKAVYAKWNDQVSFDFASFSKDQRGELPLRITWTLNEHTRVGTLNSGDKFVPIYQFELIRYLESEESNLFKYLTNAQNFVLLLQQQQFNVVSIGALDTATPDRVAMIVLAYRT